MRKSLLFNKRGATQEQIIYAIIALFILVSVLLFIFPAARDRFIPFAKFLPSFSSDNKTQSGIEELRYVVSDDKVQYYDGTKWLYFNSNNRLDFDDKSVVYSEVYGAVRNKYYSHSRGAKQIDLNDNVYAIVNDDENHLHSQDSSLSKTLFPFVDDHALFIPKGSLEIFLFVNNKGEGTYIMLDDGTLKFYSYSNSDIKNGLPGVEGRIAAEAKSWRDSIFNTPFSIPYHNIQEGKLGPLESENVCIKRYGASDLVFDLNSPADSC